VGPNRRAAAAHGGARGEGFRAVARDRRFLTLALLGVLPATLCVHAVVLGPLVADLAPPHLLGRYISLFSLMVTGGFALGPAIGGALLATSPDAVWWGGGLIAAVIGAGFLLSGSRIPDAPLAATASNGPGDPMPEAA
jgi:MFS family permease